MELYTQNSRKMTNKNIKLVPVLLIAFFIGISSFAQNDTIGEVEIIDIYQEELDPPEIYEIVDQMPEFPGGELALRKCIVKNIQLPSSHRDYDFHSKVYVKFAVGKDGLVQKVSIVKGQDKDLNKATIDAVKKLPKFKPGKHDGKPVNVWLTVPVNFRIN